MLDNKNFLKFDFPNLIKLNRYKKKVNVIFKEIENINNLYYVNFKLSSQLKLIFEIYSDSDPINLYFKSILTLDELKNFYSYFKAYTNINDIYEIINEVINKGKYEINIDENSKTNLELILSFDKEKIIIYLKNEKIHFDLKDEDLKEFINNFYNDFLNMKEILYTQINQKNDEIFKLIEENKQIKNKVNELKEQIIKLKNKYRR